MYNLRYHIASLVAVFLALAVGLLLGSAVVERGVLDDQKNSIVKSLQQDYLTRTAENRDLRMQLDRLRTFSAESAPSLVGGVLAGEHVAVIVNEGNVRGLSEVKGAIETAGGKAEVITLSRPGLGVGSPSVDAALVPLVGSMEATSQATDELAKRLAQEWSGPLSSRPFTDALVKAGVLKMTPLAESGRFDAAVLMVSWDGAPDEDAVALGAELERLGVTTVGAQAGKDPGIAAASSGAGLSAIDSIDLPESVVPFVRLLSGKATGHYGLGDGADRGMPKLR